MLTTKEAIEQRRSIRKFKPDPIPESHLTELLEAARLAPSGCNAQPWRFKIVKEQDLRLKLAEAAFNQSFIAKAPVVLVCCADVQAYLTGTVSALQDLGKIKTIEDRIVKILLKRVDQLKSMPVDQLTPQIAFNVAIAIEHVILRALDFGLGFCWVRLVDVQKVKALFGWDDNLSVVAMIPLGYPDEEPPARKRLSLEEILL